jgi:hypothetical protein
MKRIAFDEPSPGDRYNCNSRWMRALEEPKRLTPSSTETDKLMVKELNDLSMEDRERVIQEVHGVADEIDEPVEFVEERLALLDLELSKIRKKIGYERALFMHPRFVKDRAVRIMFLRSESFDARNAAKRLISYFDFKLELWGLDRLVKPISLNDFDEGDMESLLSGSMQIPATKDRSGRPILYVEQKLHKYKTWENLVRKLSWLVSLVI